jgi:Transport and Golgi organisation 2
MAERRRGSSRPEPTVTRNDHRVKDSEAMCTVVVSLAPEAPVPLLLLGIRDEFTGRPWQPPARHWPAPEWSALVGGLDEQAGGTWLAVHPTHPRGGSSPPEPAAPRVGCILNGRGEFAPPDRRRSRGELPLRAAAEGPQALKNLCDDREALTCYDPFYLVCADLDTVLLLGWDGKDGALAELALGTHMLTNAGHMYPADPRRPPDEKAIRFGPRFAARRPSGDPAATISDAWADWLTLASDDDPPGNETGAIIVRRELPDGRVYGSTSVSLVALARDGTLRYDFQPVPADSTTWYAVDIR